MGKDTGISWCDHTFNPWWGCVKVSDGCKHCYAETLSIRYGHDLWGPPQTTTRKMMSEQYWQQPYKWHTQALVEGKRRNVFCASMADVFEDHPAVVDARLRLWGLIMATPALNWLLLTKRPENIPQMIPSTWRTFGYQPNVWLGTSVENQEQAQIRIPQLLQVNALIHFLSCEPLLGPLDLTDWLDGARRINWVIVGGESGPGYRPMEQQWAQDIQRQCRRDDTYFFFKQLSGYRAGIGHDTLGPESHEVPDYYSATY